MPETGITKGKLPSESMHICVDMQKLFGAGSPWHVPWAQMVLPNVVDLCAICGEKSIFTRFLPPQRAEDAVGAWKKYYRKWEAVTLERLDPEFLELVDPLPRFIPPASVLNKSVYSPWTEGYLQTLLRKKRVSTLVISGAETDLCVLATILGAVDRGYRVIVVHDAICSAFDETHDAVLSVCQKRLSEQLEMGSTKEVIDAWQ